MKFDFSPKSNNDDQEDKKTLLSKIRNSSIGHKIIKTGTAAAIFLGVENNLQAQNKNKDKNDIKIENINSINLENNNPTPESYDVRNIFANYEERLNEIEKYKENSATLISNGIIESNKLYQEFKINYISGKQIEKSNEIQFLKDSINKVGSDAYKIKELLTKIEKENKILEFIEKSKTKEEFNLKKLNEEVSHTFSEEEKNIIKNSPEIVGAFEEAKNKVINVIKSDIYLHKLAKEFKCSNEEARHHQDVRINNVRLIKSKFWSKDNLQGETSSKAYYLSSEHSICLPYDLDINEIEESAEHELWHGATFGLKGISVDSKNLLSEKSYNYKSDYTKDENEYYKNSTERYPRFKILDEDLETLGIKQKGKKMTQDQFNKMMEVYNDQLLNKDMKGRIFRKGAIDFIMFTIEGSATETGYEIWNKLFNEIAVSDSSKENKTYQHDAWDYNDLA